MKIRINVEKDNITKLIDTIHKSINEELKKDVLFFKRNNIMAYNKHSVEKTNIYNLDTTLSTLKNKLSQSISEYIKIDNFTLNLNILFLKNTDNNVSYLNINCNTVIDNEYINLLEFSIYSFNKEDITNDLINFSKINLFTKKQIDFLNEYIEEHKPDSINLDNFIYLFEEAISSSINTEALTDLFEPNIESTLYYNYSKDIYKLLIEESDTLKLFKDKLKVSKYNYGYKVYFCNIMLKDITYEVRFI